MPITTSTMIHTSLQVAKGGHALMKFVKTTQKLRLNRVEAEFMKRWPQDVASKRIV